MRIADKNYQSIWIHEEDPSIIQVIDQRYLPFQQKIKNLQTPEDVVHAISDMVVRGAPLIGVTAAFGVYLAVIKYRNSGNANKLIQEAANKIKASRPTAVNLSFAVNKQLEAIEKVNKTDEKLNISL